MRMFNGLRLLVTREGGGLTQGVKRIGTGGWNSGPRSGLAGLDATPVGLGSNELPLLFRKNFERHGVVRIEKTFTDVKELRRRGGASNPAEELPGGLGPGAQVVHEL